MFSGSINRSIRATERARKKLDEYVPPTEGERNVYEEGDPRQTIHKYTKTAVDLTGDVLKQTPEPIKKFGGEVARAGGEILTGLSEMNEEARKTAPIGVTPLDLLMGAAIVIDKTTKGVSQVTGIDRPILDVGEMFIPYGKVFSALKNAGKVKTVAKVVDTATDLKGAQFAFKAQSLQPGFNKTFDDFLSQDLVQTAFLKNSPTEQRITNIYGGDPLMKAKQPISEILPHKSIREAGGVSLFDPARADAVQQLITQKIHTAMEAGPKFVKEMFEEIWPNVDASTLTTQQMKKKLTIALGSKTKAGGPVATSNLDRGLAEILVGDNKFLHKIGVIDEVVNNPSVLDPKNISKWLGGIDSRVSSTTGGIAKHHTTLTSSRDLLDISNVSTSWRKRFLNLMREKVTPGAEGIVKQDALAHKPFSSPKIKNKSGKLVADDTKWVVKGVLGDVLEEFTNFPKSATGDILVNKEISNIGDWSKGLEGQLQKVIRSINDKAAHAPWSRGTTGWTLDPRLGKFSPEDAFKVSEYIFDLERTVSAQGVLVTQKLNNWKKAISKGKFGNPPNIEKAIANLQNSIDNIKIDKSQIRAMEEAYQIRLDALLKGGPEALKKLETKQFIGAPRPKDLVKPMN